MAITRSDPLLERCKKLLGDEAVVEHALDATLSDIGEFRGRRLAAILRPRSAEDVQRILAAATDVGGAAIYPFSTGRNWGLGSRQPPADGCVLLDLARLDRVRELDLQRGFAVIEPGVTQGQLGRLLEGSQFQLNVTSACADTSVLGNALERGVGFTRQRTEDLRALEVVLASGEQIRVGSFWGAPGSATSTFHYRHGIGPDLLPLFCQSNLGVVTAAAVALVPRPECIRVFHVTAPEPALDRGLLFLRRLHRDGLVNNVSRIYDPPEAGAGHLLCAAFSGRRAVADAAATLLLDEARGLGLTAETSVVDETDSADGRVPVHCFRGRPGENCRHIQRSFRTTSCDLDRASAAGWLLFLPIVPFEAEVLRRARALVERIADDGGVEHGVVMNVLDATCVDLSVKLSFPRTAEGIARAHAVLERMRAACVAAGFFPYRGDIDHQGADGLFGPGPYRETLRALKRALDPSELLAPGRYLPPP